MPYQPAMSTDLAVVGNGVYRVVYSGETFEFLLHTVTRGQLLGQRIVKRRVEHTTVTGDNWEAFATLMRDGRVHVWSRHEALRGQPVAVAVQHMIDRLMNPQVATERPYITVYYDTVRCNICNDTHHTARHSGIVADAERAEREREQAAAERRRQLFGTRTRTTTTSETPMEASVQRLRDRLYEGDQAAEQRRERTFTPPMSDITPGMIK